MGAMIEKERAGHGGAPPRPTLPTRVSREVAHVRSSLLTFGPPTRGRWPLAIQAALAMSVPVVLLAALGRADLGLLAATGAFTGLYGGRATPRERAVLVPVVAVALLLSAAAGAVAAAGGTAVVLVGLLVWSVLASAGTLAFSLGPPGPIFFVLVFGLSAGVTAVHDGARVVEPTTLLAAVAGSSAFAYLLAVAPLLRRRHRRAPARSLRELLPGFRLDDGARTVLLRATAVAVVGVAAAAVVDPQRAYWVVTAGVAVVGVSAARRVTVTRGVHRAVGTVAGAALFLLLAQLGPSGVVLGLVLGALQLAVELVVVRHYALALTFITPLVLLIATAATGGALASTDVALERVVDTLVGAAIGIACAVLVAPASRELAADPGHVRG